MSELTLEKFLDIEEKYHLLEDEVDGFRYWAYKRFSFYSQLRVSAGLEKSASAGSNGFNKKRIFRIMINSLKYPFELMKLKHCSMLILPHSRRVFDGGKYKCIYTDDITDLYKSQSVVAEFMFDEGHLLPACTEKIIYLDFIEYFSVLCAHLFGKGSKEDVWTEKAKKICSIFDRELGISISSESIEASLRKLSVIYSVRKKQLEKLISKILPKVILEVVGYSFNNMIINEICEEQGITSIELQHGMITRGHTAYNFRTSDRYSFMPQKLLVFSNYWRDVCRFPIGVKNIISVGYSYFEQQKKKYPAIKKKILTFLVLSQHIYADVMKNFVKALVDYLDGQNWNYRIIYKLHPEEYSTSEKQYNEFSNMENLEIVADSKTSLYELFGKSDIQIGINSTALFEGLGYNLRTYLIEHEDVYVDMIDLVETGIAKVVGNPKEIVFDIVAGTISNSNTVDFFKEDALYNIRKVINESLCDE